MKALTKKKGASECGVALFVVMAGFVHGQEKRLAESAHGGNMSIWLAGCRAEYEIDEMSAFRTVGLARKRGRRRMGSFLERMMKCQS